MRFLRLTLIVCPLFTVELIAANVRISGLAAHPDRVVVGTPTQITISGQVGPDPNVIPTGITLVRVLPGGQQTALGSLYDDGTHGDAVANDSIYSGQFTFTEQTPGVLNLLISAASRGSLARSQSAAFSVTAYIPPTRAEISETMQIQSQAGMVYDQLIAQSPHSANAQFASYLSRQPGVGAATVSGNGQGVSVEYQNGIWGAYLLGTNGTAGGPSKGRSVRRQPKQPRPLPLFSPTSLASSSNLKALVLAPFSDDFSPYESSNQIAQDLSGACFGTVLPITNGQVTVDLMKTLSSASVISISTHGGSGFGPQGDVVLLTGEAATTDSILAHIDDIHAHRLRVGYVNRSGNRAFLAITGEFVSYYASSTKFPGSIVVANGCDTVGGEYDPGGFNYSLSQPFLTNGAQAFVGWENSVFIPFAQQTVKSLFDYLTNFFASPHPSVLTAYNSLDSTVDPATTLPLGQTQPAKLRVLGNSSAALCSPGSVSVRATLNGVPWTGGVRYNIVGPNGVTLASSVPADIPGLQPGGYTVLYQTGGPVNATVQISPTISQTMYSGQPVAFSLDFRTTNTPPIAGFLMKSGNQSVHSGPTPLNLLVPLGGTSNVTFDGSAPTYSSDSDGTVASWLWSVDGAQASTAAVFSKSLGKGQHSVSLFVGDSMGAFSPAATGTIVVVENSGVSTTTTITFESLPGPDGRLGTPDDVPNSTACNLFFPGSGFCQNIDTQYATAGVTFSPSQLMVYAGTPFGLLSGHYLETLTSVSPQLTGVLSIPVYGVRIDSQSSWPVTLKGFDAQGHLLASYSLPSSSGVGTLAISSAQPIARFTIGDESAGHIFDLDNLVLITALTNDPNVVTYDFSGTVTSRYACCGFGDPPIGRIGDAVSGSVSYLYPPPNGGAGPPPAVYSGDVSAMTVALSGYTLQSGVPAQYNPFIVQACGVQVCPPFLSGSALQWSYTPMVGPNVAPFNIGSASLSVVLGGSNSALSSAVVPATIDVSKFPNKHGQLMISGALGTFNIDFSISSFTHRLP